MDQNLFIDSGARLLFSKNQLDQFNALWELELPWFEKPNERRQGWSGVSRLELGGEAFFLKRQENHNTRTLLHPIAGVPTYKREFDNICRFRAENVPAVEAVYYGERKLPGKHQAILISRALDQHQTLAQWYLDQFDGQPATATSTPLTSTPEGKAMFDRVIAIFVKLHTTGLAHWCPYSKHIFVRPDGSDARFIDLEKARYQPFSLERRRKDLDCFLRHAGFMTRTDLEYFIYQYIEQAGNPAGAERLTRDLKKRIKKIKG